MSEYQYYEFLAIDQPLDARQIKAVRAYSTRAEITPTQFVNEYHWGDFRGDVRKFMTRYFDAMVYVANWGTRRFMCRLPADVVDDPSVLEPYETETVVAFDRVEGHVLVDLTANDECPEDDWREGQQWMASLSLLRTEWLCGDWRGLYLAWLRAVDQVDVDDDALEPPVPAGLAQLSPAQHALVRFLEIDQDLLAAAQQASEPLHEPAGADQWLATLPAADKDRLLQAVWQGQAAKVQGELWRKWRQRTATENRELAPRRRVSQLHQIMEDVRSQRRQAEAERRAHERAAREAKEAAARQTRLKSLAQRQSQAWAEVEQWIESRLPGNYDQSVARLVDLAELARQQNEQADFDQRLADLVCKHGRKSTWMKRLNGAGLK